MTDADLVKIEESLGIKLPESYKAVMQRLDLGILRGNNNQLVYDCADEVIEENRQLHGDGIASERWPPEWFALGRDSGGDSIAINLLSEQLRFVSKGILLSPMSHDLSSNIETWMEHYIADCLLQAEDEFGCTSVGNESPNIAKLFIDFMWLFSVVFFAILLAVFILILVRLSIRKFL